MLKIADFTYMKSKTSIAIKVMHNFNRNSIVESISSAANLFHIGGIRYSKPKKIISLHFNK